MSKPNHTPQQSPRKVYPTRRFFSVKEQLVGKLGPRGYGQLLDQLQKITVEPAPERPKRRRRRRARKAVA